MLEQEWQKIICKVRDELVICPHCHEESLLDLNKGNCKCMNCGKDIDSKNQLKIGQRSMILTPGTKLYVDNDNIADGQVDVYPKDPTLMVIRNLTKASWHVDTPSGKVKVVEPNDFMPVLNGLKISFGTSIPGAPGAKAEIVVK